MEAADYEVLSVREQLFHERVRECIVSVGPGQKRVGPSRGEARVSRERKKLGLDRNHMGSGRQQTLLGPGTSDQRPRSDQCSGWRTPDRVSWVAAR